MAIPVLISMPVNRYNDKPCTVQRPRCVTSLGINLIHCLVMKNNMLTRHEYHIILPIYVGWVGRIQHVCRLRCDVYHAVHVLMGIETDVSGYYQFSQNWINPEKLYFNQMQMQNSLNYTCYQLVKILNGFNWQIYSSCQKFN